MWRLGAASEWEPASVAAAPLLLEKPSPKQPRRRGAVSYARQDAPLIAEMHKLIDSYEAPSVIAAAGMVVKNAIGSGTDESKVRRLTKGYSANY